jgi:hypothetical protein
VIQVEVVGIPRLELVVQEGAEQLLGNGVGQQVKKQRIVHKEEV